MASGTEPFAATLDYVLDINPTAWVTPGTGANQGARAPGNRLFVDVYWKKDGVIMTDTRISHYIRGDEDWAPSDHKLHGVFSEIMAPGHLDALDKPDGGRRRGQRNLRLRNRRRQLGHPYRFRNRPPGSGSVERDVLAQTTYAAATAGSANTSGTQALPERFCHQQPVRLFTGGFRPELHGGYAYRHRVPDIADRFGLGGGGGDSRREH